MDIAQKTNTNEDELKRLNELEKKAGEIYRDFIFYLDKKNYEAIKESMKKL